MTRTIDVPPLRRWELFLNDLFVPVMHVVTGTFYIQGRGTPQQTHRWNNKRLTSDEVKLLDEESMVHHDGDPDTHQRFCFGLPTFHMPIAGGWKQYVVLEPLFHTGSWYVGWVTPDVCGVSRIELYEPARLLIGPQHVKWFGLNAETGTQIIIRNIASGTLWEPNMYEHCPLL